MLKPLLTFVLTLLLASLHAQENITAQPTWSAHWISVPDTDLTKYGVYVFRKTANLPSKPSEYKIKVSADNRYKLFINQQLVSMGPARGDLNNWNYETIDIANHLQQGNNVIAAQVWNEGNLRAEAQISLMTGFILEGLSPDQNHFNTGEGWKCATDSSYQPIPVKLPDYYVSGPGEHVTMKSHLKNFQSPSFNDNQWKVATVLFPGTPKNMGGPFGIANGWMLTPSILPQMELKQERFAKVRKQTGITVPESFPNQKHRITIAANKSATLLLDNGQLTNAFPTIIFSGGNNAEISWTYAEALYTKHPHKGNRNEVEGKQIMGRKDVVLSDGSASQQYTPLTWRTYRYVELNIATKDQPLVIEDLYGTFTGYPFTLKAKLETQNQLMQQIFNIGWHTARLCAVETYMDCPYYEQLQYIGDARIQALISIYNTGDERLLKNAINLMDNSRHADGLTESRHPSVHAQYIPTFSLWYVGMLHDYMMYGADSSFLKTKLNGARQVLQYFKRYQQPDGSLKNNPWWMFTDWVHAKDWREGIAPAGKDGYSAVLDLQLLWAYQLAADMERKMGNAILAGDYEREAKLLMGTVKRKYWDANRGLYTDRTEKDVYSQHTNSLAILTGVATADEAKAIATKLLSDTSLAPASIYFKYYLHRALIKAGRGGEYVQWLGKWKENIDMGLTTWAEMSEVSTSRSDCHAWGSSPNIEFFRTVLGIDTDAPFFSRVRIEPRLGNIQNIKGEIPHHKGRIAVEISNGTARIELPQGLTGSFVWKGKVQELKSGVSEVRL